MSDHFLVEARLKLVGGWRSAGRMKGARNMLKVRELNNRVKERAYQESLLKCGNMMGCRIVSDTSKYEVWRWGGGRECGGVGKVQKYSNGVYK